MTRNRHQSALYARLRPRITTRIRDLRRAAEPLISQDKLSAITGIHKASISQIESGRQLPRLVQLVAISLALNCTINDLLTITPE